MDESHEQPTRFSSQNNINCAARQQTDRRIPLVKTWLTGLVGALFETIERISKCRHVFFPLYFSEYIL